jgi:hypothetical protein
LAVIDTGVAAEYMLSSSDQRKKKLRLPAGFDVPGARQNLFQQMFRRLPPIMRRITLSLLERARI